MAKRRTEALDPPDAAMHAKRIAHRAVWVEPELLAEIEYCGVSRRRAEAPVAQGTARAFVTTGAQNSTGCHPEAVIPPPP